MTVIYVTFDLGCKVRTHDVIISEGKPFNRIVFTTELVLSPVVLKPVGHIPPGELEEKQLSLNCDFLLVLHCFPVSPPQLW